MFRNNLPISRIIGISVIAIAVFIFSLLYEELRRIYEYQEYYDDYSYTRKLDATHYMAISATTLVFLTGIGLILGYAWARILMFLGFLGALGLWVFGVLLKNFNNINERVSMLGFTLFLITIFISIVLLLYNKKVAPEFGDVPYKNDFDDAMDADLLDIE